MCQGGGFGSLRGGSSWVFTGGEVSRVGVFMGIQEEGGARIARYLGEAFSNNSTYRGSDTHTPAGKRGMEDLLESKSIARNTSI